MLGHLSPLDDYPVTQTRVLKTVRYNQFCYMSLCTLLIHNLRQGLSNSDSVYKITRHVIPYRKPVYNQENTHTIYCFVLLKTVYIHSVQEKTSYNQFLYEIFLARNALDEV